MSTAVTATPAIDTAIDRAFTDNRFVGAVVLIARDGKIVYRRAGGIGFAVSSEDDIEQERPVLSSIAEELGFTFVAVILRVEDPDRMARAARCRQRNYASSRAGPFYGC